MVVAQETMEWQEAVTQAYPKVKARPTKKRKEYHKIKSILALACIVLLTGAIGAETIQLTVVRGAQIRNLEKEISTIKMKNDLLQMETDKLRAVGRIESVALSMGMEKPTGKVYMTGAVPAVKIQKGAPTTQAVNQQTEANATTLQQFSQIFTSFFASTQR